MQGYTLIMAKQIFLIFKWLLIFALIVGVAGSVFVAIKLNRPSTDFSAARDFEVKKNETAGQIVSRLAAESLIRNELTMEIYLRLKNAENKLQAGIYILDSNMTIPEIVQILSQGLVKASGLRLTVIEGWSVTDIAQRLENLTIMQREEFTEAAAGNYAEFAFLNIKPADANLEGFLFPDTYLIKEGSSGETVARKMLENFGSKVPAEITYDALILASIVELEVGRNFKTGTRLTDQDLQMLTEERRIVAGIFLNRLEIGMGLESDATINYITGKNNPQSLLEDLKIDSPYNTYKYRGLPPTPIGNPSLDSINAVLHPADTDYLFFLTEPDGTAHFGHTLEEHSANRMKYLE